MAALFASKYPDKITKLILVSSGPFEASYAEGLMPLRMSRLSENDRKRVDALLLGFQTGKVSDTQFLELGDLMTKADSFNPIEHASQVIIQDNFDTYQRVWDEAAELRKSEKLLAAIKKITCPVVAIHGDYDSHAAEGIKKPLSEILPNLRFILLKNSGHTPWYEKETKDKFYEILEEEITNP